MSSPLILLTNDDGIEAPGIRALWEALRSSGYERIAVIAPQSEQSGTGCSITWNRPIKIQQVTWEDDTPAWSIDGTPADCVKIGDRILLEQTPDLIVSGINAGSNAGRNVLHSGTVGAAIEGVLRGIPSIAFSCEDGQNPNFEVAQKYIGPFMDFILSHPLPEGSLLNVNIPHIPSDQIKGVRMTHHGQGRWSENPYVHMKTQNDVSYWMGGKPEEKEEIPDCDIAWMRRGFVTAVPIHVHQLTDRTTLESLKDNLENFLETSAKELS